MTNRSSRRGGIAVNSQPETAPASRGSCHGCGQTASRARATGRAPRARSDTPRSSSCNAASKGYFAFTTDAFHMGDVSARIPVERGFGCSSTTKWPPFSTSLPCILVHLSLFQGGEAISKTLRGPCRLTSINSRRLRRQLGRSGAHAAVEWVELDDLKVLRRVLLSTAEEFCA